MSKTEVMVDTTVIADTKKIWEYWNSPKHITKWNYSLDGWHCPNVENDLKVGVYH